MWCWRRLLRVPRTARRSNQSILKEINPGYWKDFVGKTVAEAEVLILWPPDTKSPLTGQDCDAGKDWEQEEKRVTEDEKLGWHHWFYGHEFKQTLEDGERQGSLACYSQSRGLQRVRQDLATEQKLLLPEVNLMMLHSSAIIRNYNEQYSY